jgi:hypothetical protein
MRCLRVVRTIPYQCWPVKSAWNRGTASVPVEFAIRLPCQGLQPANAGPYQTCSDVGPRGLVQTPLPCDIAPLRTVMPALPRAALSTTLGQRLRGERPKLR